MCGAACGVAPQTYSPARPAWSGVNSRMARVPVSYKRRVTRKRLFDAPGGHASKSTRSRVEARVTARFADMAHQFGEGDRVRHLASGAGHTGEPIGAVDVDHAVGDLHVRDGAPGQVVAVLPDPLARDRERT